MVLLFHIHVFCLLHTLWNDDCGSDTKLPNCCNCYVLLSDVLEHILGLPYPKIGMYSKVMIKYIYTKGVTKQMALKPPLFKEYSSQLHTSTAPIEIPIQSILS